MSQHDYVIANGTGAAVRSDLNNALAAIVTQNSGATAPATTYSYQWWADTTTGLLKLRNAANNAWITLFQLDGEWSTLAVENGSAAAPSIYFKDSGTDTGIYSPGTDQVAISTNGSHRLRITASGDVGIGTTTPTNFANYTTLDVRGATGGIIQSSNGAQTARLYTTGSAGYVGTSSNDPFIFNTNDVERLRITSAGLVGIGTTTPTNALQVVSGSNYVASFNTSTIPASSSAVSIGGYLNSGAGGSGGAIRVYHNHGASVGSSIAFEVNGATEAVRIDDQRRLLVGTSTSASTTANVVVQGSSNGQLELRCATDPSSSGTALGVLRFTNNSGGLFAQIYSESDGTISSSSDLPGRLVFSTTADGASSPTERMRINQAGAILIGKTEETINTAGGAVYAGYTSCTRSGANPLVINRLTNDGELIDFRQDGTQEGTISVSGTTVSYNGAHLSRWSQILGIDPHDKDARPEILRGTVMSNLDEMCDWIDPESGDAQDNEQLNKTKISDVEGDKNVAGIFQSWDDDDDIWVNDYYLAMTGDFIIRIAEGVTVERGDLLMSAGDGTAKPQDDDIIRSKTIAKVTSTTVSCTYEDGSYCVPCVLMAC